MLNKFSIKNKQGLNSVILVKQQNVTTGETKHHYRRMWNAMKNKNKTQGIDALSQYAPTPQCL